MSNDLITFDSGLQAVRVLKSGKQQTRGALGIITSGNREETASMGMAVALNLIRNNTFAPVVREIVRVFNLTDAKPAVWKGKKGEAAPVGAVVRAAGVGHIRVEADGTLSPIKSGGPIDVSQGCNKAQALAIAEAVVEKCNGKEVKGEKAFYLQAARAIVAKCNEPAPEAITADAE